MAANKILVVEDEQAIREMIVFHLSRAGFETLEAGDSRDARQLLADEQPDLALIDWMLPDMSGFDVCRDLRQQKIHTPILMLTARGFDIETHQRSAGGILDVLSKPFSPREVVARVKAVLRRSSGTIQSRQVVVLDSERYTATVGGKKLDLTAVEFQLLKKL